MGGAHGTCSHVATCSDHVHSQEAQRRPPGGHWQGNSGRYALVRLKIFLQ